VNTTSTTYFNTLISVRQLESLYDEDSCQVFDCRHDLGNPNYGREAYKREHIPGAIYMHLDDDLSGSCTGSNGRHPLPETQTLAKRLAERGVGSQTLVVAYDNEGGPFAARLWWLMRWLGHQKVAVLDGGLAAWKQARLALEQLSAPVEAAEFQAQPNHEAIVEAAAILSSLSQDNSLLLDARSEDRFSGERETIDPVGGHIPGALNRFYFDNLDDNGIFFKKPNELREEFLTLLAGRDPGEVIHQCGSGVTACHNLLAMEVAGLRGSKLYPGSWSEWCSDPSRPVAR